VSPQDLAGVGQEVSAAPVRLRRVPTARETSSLVVAGALPRGYVRPATQGQWRAVARPVLAAAGLRADRRRSTVTVAKHLMYHADWDTMTSRPTWAVLVERLRADTGMGSRSTVARALATLVALDLVARVAPGRRGCHAPGGCRARTKQAGPCLTPGACPPDEAGVYVLCVPSTLAPVPDQVEYLDDTPPHLGMSETHPVHARGKNCNEPLRGTAPLAAPTVPQPSGAPCRPAPAQPSRATARRKDDRRAHAEQVRSRIPVLQGISTADVAAVLLVFWMAGWTVADVVHAVEWRPDGTRWPHDGATGVPASGGRTPDGRRGGPRGWLRHRLAPWTVDGTATRSPAQRRAADHARDLARHQALIDQTTTAGVGPGSSLAVHTRWHRDAPAPECRWCQP